MSISLCMISRDEEVFIDSCLKSVVDLVDEIIIVDTGSTDNTVEIANKYNAKVINSIWKKNFAHHRNESIKYATCDWILILDCDEIIDNTDFKEIKLLLENINDKYMGFNLKIINIDSNRDVASFNALRLFRNNKDFYFSGIIHEQIINSIIDEYGNDCICDIPITIKHYGYDESIIKSKNKFQRNIELLESIYDKDCYILAMIGDEYFKINNLEKAITYYEKSLNMNNNFFTDYSYMLVLNYVTSLINLRHFTKALDVINYYKDKLPNFRDLYFLEFWILFFSNDYDKANIKLNDYINFPNKYNKYFEVKKFYNIYDFNNIKQLLQTKTNS